MTKPLLSICIPTYQRCEVLRRTVESIVQNSTFESSNDIELVISNNASTDGTDEYCQWLVEKYGEKIRYSKNIENIKDLNFDVVLRKASGRLRKLHNDSFLIKDEFFSEIIPFIKQIQNFKPSVFFLNGNSAVTEFSTICANADELLGHIGYNITWSGGFCIWEDDLISRPDFDRMHERRFIQVDSILRDLEVGKKFLVFNNSYFVGQSFGKKLDYNAAQIFGDNLVDMIGRCQINGLISEDVFFEFKYKLLFNHIVPSHFNSALASHQTGFNKYLKLYYEDAGFIDHFLKMYSTGSSYSGDGRLFLNSIIWRMINSHNETGIKNYIDLNKVKVAHRTYGTLNVGSWGADNESLEIGALCSIGDNVNFMLGGNHDLHHLTTYPFKVKLGVTQNEASSKGAIVVEDDVWIGNNCTILSGVRIGRGAVIGTGSVIAKDVPPYAVMVGNPASVVKYRFSPDVITHLMKIDLKKLAQLENLQSHLEVLYAIVNEDSCPQIIEYFRQLQCLTDDHL